MKKILIIAPDFMGYVDRMAEELKKNQTIELTVIHLPIYQYPNFKTKFKNFFLKIISKDIKFNFRRTYINNVIKNREFDTILLIRPDLLDSKFLHELKNKCVFFKTYFFDGVDRFPAKLKIKHLFDEIFSFDPYDCKKFGFKFITNFIYEQKNNDNQASSKRIDVFNITSYDKKRFSVLLKIAKILEQQGYKHNIIVKTDRKIETNGLITITSKPIVLTQVQHYINESKCMLDIGVTHKHKGLTFRVFEAMGLDKKIITNNEDIINYDFYNPQNILVITNSNPIIPKEFMETSYCKIPNEIYQKYTVENWVKTVFKENF